MKINDNNDSEFQQAISMLSHGSVDLGVQKLAGLAKQGDCHADAALGVVFEFGKGHLAPDQHQALEHYERSISCGSLEGWLGIGRICLRGPSELRDVERALECFTKVAISADLPQAWLAIGEINLHGHGVQIDLDKASAAFERAADLGNVHGFLGLARVALKKGQLVRSMKFRGIAFLRAMRAFRSGARYPLKKW